MREPKEIKTKEDVIEKWIGKEAISYLWTGNEEWVDKDAPAIITGLCNMGTVCEIGCGAGRVASLFTPDIYIGTDINPVAIAQAKERLPSHDFRVVQFDDPYPKADIGLFYTVLLHIPDEFVQETINKCNVFRYVVVFESMDRSLRKLDFQRSKEDYVNLFRTAGFIPITYLHEPSVLKPFFRDYLVFKKQI